MSKVDPKDLLKAGGHFGHKTSRWHPKMAPYIYTKKQGVHIIDLTKTVDLLEDAAKFVEEAVAKGGNVLFVGTKRQARDVVKAAADKTGMPYVVDRWLGGMLTNANTMSTRIKRLKMLEKQLASGELEAKYNKLEVQRFEEELERLQFLFGGVADMEGNPAVVFVVDVTAEHNAVREANRLHIPVVGVCDTNSDPTPVDFVVPANDDAIKSIQLIADRIVAAVEAGKAKQKKAPKQEEKDDKKGGK